MTEYNNPSAASAPGSGQGDYGQTGGYPQGGQAQGGYQQDAYQQGGPQQSGYQQGGQPQGGQQGYGAPGNYGGPQGGYAGPDQQQGGYQQGGQSEAGNFFSALFSPRFDTPMVERFAGIAFIIGAILLAAEWFADLFTLVSPSSAPWGLWLAWIVAGAVVLLKIVVLRVFLEIGVSVARIARSKS